jgi:hypothetical protein
VLKPLIVLVIVAVLLTIPIVRAVRLFSQRSPHSRPYLIAGAVAILIGVAFATPRLDRIAPHMRESPAAVFPILGAAVGLGIAGLCAAGVIIGVALSHRLDRDDPAA